MEDVGSANNAAQMGIEELILLSIKALDAPVKTPEYDALDVEGRG
jgi:hypothetical protein